MVPCPSTFNTRDELVEHRRTPHLQPACSRPMPPQYEYDPWEGTHWEGKSKVEVIREVAGGLFTDEIAADVELREAAITRVREEACCFPANDVRYRDALLSPASHAPVLAVRGVSQLSPASSYIPRVEAVEPSLQLPKVPWWEPVSYLPSTLPLEVSTRSGYKAGQSYPNPPFPPTMSAYWVPKCHSRATPPPPGTPHKVRPAKSTEKGSSEKYDTSWVPNFLKKRGSNPKEPRSGKAASPLPLAPKSPSTAMILAERRKHERAMPRRPKARSNCAPQSSSGAPSPPSGAPSPPRGATSPPRVSPSPHMGALSSPSGAPSLPSGAPSLDRGAPSPPMGAPSSPMGDPSPPRVSPSPHSVASTSSNPKVRIMGVTSWAGMPVFTLKGGGTEPGDSPTPASPGEREEAFEDHSETELECSPSSKDEASKDEELPEARSRSSPGPSRLDTLRPNRVSDWLDSSESAASGADTRAPGGGGRSGGGRRGAGGSGGGGRGAVRGRGAGRGVGRGRGAVGRRGAGSGRGACGRSSAVGGRGEGSGLVVGGGHGPVGENNDVEESFDEVDEMGGHEEQTTIIAWEESEELSDTHDEFIEEPNCILSEEFSGDESDTTIKKKYKESKENQLHRGKIKAREIFKEKIMKSSGFACSEVEKERKRRRKGLIKRTFYNNGEDGGDEDDSPDEAMMRSRNRPFRYLRERQQQQQLHDTETEIVAQNLFRDKDHMIAFSKRVLEREGFKIEKEAKEVSEKTLMLAMSFQAKNKLTQDQYESLRFSNRAMGNSVDWPSWRDLLEGRKRCRPENIVVNKQGAFYNIRDVITHNIQR